MRRALALLVALAGCTQQGTGVELLIDAGGLTLDRLKIDATYDGRTVTHTVDVVATPTLDLIAQLPDESTTVIFDVTAFAAGQPVGHGASSSIAVTSHRLSQAMITLLPGGGGGDGFVPADLGDGGALWTHQQGALPPSAGAIRGLWGSSGGDVYAVGPATNGTNVFHTTNHGATWAPQLAGTIDLNAVGGTSPTDVYLVGDNATILHGSGTSWNTQTNPALVNTRLLSIWAIGSVLYVTGSGNTILRNSGSGWVTEPLSAGTTELRGIWGVSGHLWAVGSAGTILKSTGNGQWTMDTSGTTNELRGIFGTSATDVWVVGDGVVLHFDGNSWSPAADGVPAGVNLRAVGGLPAGPVWAVGNAWTVVRRDAAAWVVEPTGVTVDDLAGDTLQAIWGASLADVYAGGAGQIILHRP